MARARGIKPGFFRNADLVELPVETRLLFIGLWTIADREGRLEDRPKQIKMELYPADSYDVNSMLQQLHDSGFIQRYEHNKTRYIQVATFSKHQNPHRDEKASSIPAPIKHDASTMQTPCKEDANTVLPRLTPDSLLLTPESLIEPSSSPKQKRFDDVDVLIAEEIFDGILKINPGSKKPNFDSWATEVSKMRRIDKRGQDEILKLFAWANADAFWKSNILSPGKLREKWDQLTIRMNSPPQPPGKPAKFDPTEFVNRGRKNAGDGNERVIDGESQRVA